MEYSGSRPEAVAPLAKARELSSQRAVTTTMSQPWEAVGIDRANGSWVAVGIDTTGTLRAAQYESIEGCWKSTTEDRRRIVVDIPIGLCGNSNTTDGCRETENGRSRGCDDLARTVLGKRAASVFTPPSRPVTRKIATEELTYADASTLNREQTGKGLMRQAANIAPAIWEVDQFLRATPDAQEHIIEGHPELAFQALADRPLTTSKHTVQGINERLTILENTTRYRAGQWRALADSLTGRIGIDDLLDATVLAVTATAPDKEFHTLPAQPPHDAMGLPMRIAYRRSTPFDVS